MEVIARLSQLEDLLLRESDTVTEVLRLILLPAVRNIGRTAIIHLVNGKWFEGRFVVGQLESFASRIYVTW